MSQQRDSRTRVEVQQAQNRAESASRKAAEAEQVARDRIKGNRDQMIRQSRTIETLKQTINSKDEEISVLKATITTLTRQVMQIEAELEAVAEENANLVAELAVERNNTP